MQDVEESESTMLPNYRDAPEIIQMKKLSHTILSIPLNRCMAQCILCKDYKYCIENETTNGSGFRSMSFIVRKHLHSKSTKEKKLNPIPVCTNTRKVKVSVQIVNSEQCIIAYCDCGYFM